MELYMICGGQASMFHFTNNQPKARDGAQRSTMVSYVVGAAGIQAVKLEDLERRLRGDMLAEAQRWGGKILLHREVLEGRGMAVAREIAGERVQGTSVPGWADGRLRCNLAALPRCCEVLP